MTPRLSALALAVLLAGCGTSPVTHYHTLQSARPVASGGGAARLVEVLPVLVPGPVDRAELVLTRAGGQIDVHKDDLWAGNLAEELRGVVAEALWREAKAADVYAAPVPSGASDLPQYRLAVRFEQFAATPDGAFVAAAWTLRRLPEGRALVCRSAARRGIATLDAVSAARALAEASHALATEIAAGLAALDRGVGCPAP